MNAKYSIEGGSMAYSSPAMPVSSGSTTFRSYGGTTSQSAPSPGEGATRTSGTGIATEDLTNSHTGSSRDGSDSEDPTTPSSDFAQQQHDIANNATDAVKQEDLNSQQPALDADNRERLIGGHLNERRGNFSGLVTPLLPKVVPLQPPSNEDQRSPIPLPASSAPGLPTSPDGAQGKSLGTGTGGFSNRSSPLSDISDSDSIAEDEDAGPSASIPAQEKKTAKRAASVRKGATTAKKQKTDAASPPSPNKRRKMSARVPMPKSEMGADETGSEPGPSYSAARFSQDDVPTLIASQQSIPQDLDAADRAAMETALAEDSRQSSRPRRAASNKSRASYVEVKTEIDDAANEDNSPQEGKKAKGTGPSRPSAAVVNNVRFQMCDRWYEYQAQNCQQRRWSRWYKCTHCTAKQMGDTCRFINLRIFPLRSLDGKLTLADPEDHDAREYAPFFGSEIPRKVKFDYPGANTLYPSAIPGSISDIKSTVAASLVQTMKMELDHAAKPETLWRNHELVIRPQCDFCLTSVFSASYFCRCCGKEYCLECTEVLKGKENNTSERNQVASVKKCRLKREHAFSELSPLTRFRVEELEDEVREMEKVQQSEASLRLPLSEAPDRLPEQPVQLGGPERNAPSAVASRSPPPEERTRQWYKSLDGPTVDEAIGSHQLTELRVGEDEAVFRKLWARGEPLIVHDCIREPRQEEEARHAQVVGEAEHPFSQAPHAEWDPESFCSSRWQKEPCRITRCDADNAHQDVNVSDFFSTFGKSPEEKVAKLGKGVWKLKDWPPSSAFDDAFPDLYKHFNKALPIPAFTRRDGRMNISALFPTNANAPDLGPKMYNAWPSSEDQVGMGSTRLHMDIADAVNIMYYAAKPPNAENLPLAHRDGVAAWDIFPAEDSNKIREYLRETRKVEEYEDPIHSQRYFLGAGDRQKLWDTKGVRSWRIYQKARDAIFIPAGCAHQVCNLTDCMKIAVDFVSPENVARCFRLTAEFRALSNNKVRSWKEDVLQLKSMLWHAWRACREMEGHKYDGGGAVYVEEGQVKPPARYSKPFSDFDKIHKPPKRKRKPGRGAKDVDPGDSEDESMLDEEGDEGQAAGSKASVSSAKAKPPPKAKAKAKGKVATKRTAVSANADETLDEEDEQPSSPPITSRRASASKPAPTYLRKGKKSEAATASNSAIVIADDEDDENSSPEASSSAAQPISIGSVTGRPRRQAAAAGTRRIASLSWHANPTEADEDEDEDEDQEDESDEDEAVSPAGRRRKSLPVAQAKGKAKGKGKGKGKGKRKEKAASKTRSTSIKIPAASSSSPSPAAGLSLPTLPPLFTLSPHTPRSTHGDFAQLTAALQASEETLRVTREQMGCWFAAMEERMVEMRRCAEHMRGMLEKGQREEERRGGEVEKMEEDEDEEVVQERL